MSKYVITKDGEVFDIHEYWLSKAFEIEPNEDYWVDEMLRKKGIDKKDCKVVSTIEKLCDRYVLHHTDIIFLNKEHTKYRFENEPNNWYDITDTEIRVGVYGAIWTDEGLIYVAKMNEKGEWELLWKSKQN